MTYSQLNYLSSEKICEQKDLFVQKLKSQKEKHIVQQEQAITVQEIHVLSEEQLLEQFARLVRSERKITHLILKHLAEIDRRRLYLSKAYSSLFDYLTKGYGYSPGAAMRRIDGARLLMELPEVAEKIESGKIQLSQLSQLQQAVREVKKLEQRIVSSDEKRDILQQMEQSSQRESEKIIAESLELPVPSFAKTVVHRDDSVTFTVTLTKQQQEILEAAKRSISHCVPSGNWSEVLVYLAEKELKRRYGKIHNEKDTVNGAEALEPDAAAVAHLRQTGTAVLQDQDQAKGEAAVLLECAAKKSESAGQRRSPLPSAQRRRAIAVPLRKSFIHIRARCQFRDPQTGRECQSRSFLQMDHVRGVSAGGGDQKENLQVLCGKHNRWKFESI